MRPATLRRECIIHARRLFATHRRKDSKSQKFQEPAPSTDTFPNYPRSKFTSHTNLHSTGGAGNGKDKRFVDLKVINVISGAGGNGGIFFDKTVVMGVPFGGNGGRGGDVWIVASDNISSLGGVLERYKAESGVNGGRQNMHGRNAHDVEILVPVGTLVKQVDSLADIFEAERKRKLLLQQQEIQPNTLECEHSGSNLESQHNRKGNVELDEINQDLDEEEVAELRRKEKEEKRLLWEQEQLDFINEHFVFSKDYIPHPDRIELLKSRIFPPLPAKPAVFLDLSRAGDRYLVARGGRGGFGNTHFASSDMKGPGIAGRGEKAENFWLELELKTIADAGLVGLPNAGKSTLLKRITNANPKIASYPFTTLNPYVGTIEYPDSYSITVADIPGLVAGAHLNIGLGHQFLRHVERSNVLVYVIDLSGLDPAVDFLTLRDELEKYKPGLTRKPSIVLANKADLGYLAKSNLTSLQYAVSASAKINDEHEMLLIPISARDDKNIQIALHHLRSLVDKNKNK